MNTKGIKMHIKQQIYISVGIPGSGKSTIAQEYCKNNPRLLVINKDAIREMLRVQYIFRSDLEPLVKHITNDAIYLAIKSGFDVFIDECNITEKQRAELITTILQFFDGMVELHAIEFEPGEHCLERRMSGDLRGLTKARWIQVHNEMLSEFEPVSFNEGFNFIKVIPKPKQALSEYDLQKKYCDQHKLPVMAPASWSCPSCKRSINPSSLVDIYHYAETNYITLCPHCNYSFV
jgi:predicted kinase